MRVIRWIFSSLILGAFCSQFDDPIAQSAYTPFKDTLGLPNFSLISSGYETFATVWRPTGDSLPIYTADFLNYHAINGEDDYCVVLMIN